MITRISVIGIAAITAALIILLSAFNGIEKMIEQLYSEYDTDITIRIVEGKTFNQDRIDISKLKALSEIKNVSRAVEEVVILKHENKWVNANLIGVDTVFLQMTDMKNHMVNGKPILKSDKGEYGIIGATLLDKLDGYIPEDVGHESIICYLPKSDIKIKPGKNPFLTNAIKLSGRMNYNREVNAESIVVSISLAHKLVDNKQHISAVYIDAKSGVDNEDLKEKIQQMLGNEFVVKTNYEKNELIFQTSKSEKIIVFIILIFIFILAAFNLVASLTMLFVEKLDDIKTLQSIGANRTLIFRVFFIEGLLISLKGIVFGALIGYSISFAQVYGHFVTMPNSNGEPFPMVVSAADGVLILTIVGVLSILFSYFPVKYLIRKNLVAKAS